MGSTPVALELEPATDRAPHHELQQLLGDAFTFDVSLIESAGSRSLERLVELSRCAARVFGYLWCCLAIQHMG